MPQHKTAESWWQIFYQGEFAHFMSLPEAMCFDFIQAQLQLQPGDKVFDQCCGTGRLSLAMARLGYEVFGVDQSAEYIQIAAAEQTQEKVHFTVADAFEYSTPQPCQGAINWRTSFGYTSDDQQNLEMLLRIYDSLKPGGRFLLDFHHRAYVERHFQAESRKTFYNCSGLRTLVKRSVIEEDMLKQEWIFEFDFKEPIRRFGQTKLYTPEALRYLLEQSGLKPLKAFGNVAGEALNTKSPRCILLAEKSRV